MTASRTRKAGAEPTTTLYVFVPSLGGGRALQADLQARIQGVKVVVLGRGKDVKKQLAANPSAAVLAPSPVIAQLGLPVSLQGLRDGKPTQPMALVRLGSNGSTIGALDLLGRKAMPGLLEELLGDRAPADMQVKRVRNTRDLRSLLLLKQADGVVMNVSDARKLVQQLGSDASLELLDGVGLGLPALGTQGAATALVGTLKSLPKASMKGLGLDGWK